MITQEKLDDISQVINSMEQSILSLEQAFREKNSAEMESAKRTVLSLQKKISEELK